MKRSVDEIAQTPSSDLSKTERRRLAKQRKKEKQKGDQTGGGVGGGPVSAGGRAVEGNKVAAGKGKKDIKPKMTKEERRAKYTQKAYEAREKQNQAAPGANKTRCLGCRGWGHVVANCPDAKASTGICFNCGSYKHALRVCPKPKQADGSLPHATCFVCKGNGHISAQCKQNPNGIYPKGGFCKQCGSKHHLFWECPDRPESEKQRDRNKQQTAVEASRDVESSDDEKSTADEPHAPTDTPRSAVGKSGSVTVHATVDGGAVSRRVDREAKRRKPDNPGQSARGAKQAPPMRLPGGDDLEDDDYFEPEDVPALQGADDGAEDGDERSGVVGAATKPLRASAKKSKVVVF